MSYLQNPSPNKPRRAATLVTWALLAGVALTGAIPHARAEDEPEPLFNMAMYVNPAEGESQSKGETKIFHAGKGEPPATGYFKQHTPGEVAEYHLFIPEKLNPKKRYPLLIVYHGGKDGASGKGTLRGMSRISTKQHPVIVLSPNMYTMDAYNELMQAGDLPIDPHRVVVFGFSSGGMGVRSAMAEFVRTEGAFKPAVLIAASTTASLGRAAYPQVPYIVMAGEKETPAFIKNKILKNRRRTCRKHALGMQQVIAETRYLEMRGHGHTSGKPEHHAAIRNMIRGLPEPRLKLKVAKNSPADLDPLVAAAFAGHWAGVHAEIKRLDASPTWASKIAYKVLRTRVLKAVDGAIKSEVKLIAGIKSTSPAWRVMRAFTTYDQLEASVPLFADTPLGAKLTKHFETLSKAKHWQKELAARARYRKTVEAKPSQALITALEAVRKEHPGTEFGQRRAMEKLLALRL